LRGTEQLLIKYFVSVSYWRRKQEYSGTDHQLFMDFKTMTQSGRSSVQYYHWIWYLASKLYQLEVM